MFYVSLYLYGDHRDLHVLTHSFPTRRSSDLLREAATWYVVGGRATGSARAAKLAGLKARLFGGDPRALSLIVSSETGRGGARAIADFVSASGGAQAMADRALKTSSGQRLLSALRSSISSQCRSRPHRAPPAPVGAPAP